MLRYSLVFDPQPLPGFSLEQVQSHLCQLLKLNDAQVKELYCKSKILLKKGLERDQANAYQKKLAEYGICVTLEPEFSLELEPMDEPESSADSQPTNDSSPFALPDPAVTKARPKTSSGRLGTPLDPTDRLHPPRERRTSVEFTGDGKEYFGIWIVNVVLTILTLGIYSAWAKVRNRQYFYGNTWLDDNNFQYLANPVAILKLLIIAFFAWVAWSAAAQVSPIASTLFLLVLIPFFPWVLSRSLRFNAINTSYRGVRFNFVGEYWGAAKVIALWFIVSPITFSLALPLTWQRKQKYQVENARFGMAAFRFTGNVTDYYMLALKVILVVLAIIVVIALGFIALSIFGVLAFAFLAMVLGPLTYIVNALIIIAIYTIEFGYFLSGLTNLYINNIELAGHKLESNMDARTTAWIYFTNTVFILFTLGLFIPWAKVRMASYRASCTTAILAGDLDKFVAIQEEQMSALGQELGDMFDMDIAII